MSSAWDLELHPWRPAGPTDVRSPCPGLNILANHGFIPHSGREISFTQLSRALQEVYNISAPVATIFTCLAICIYGSLWSWTLSLDALAVRKTIRLEHPASLFHLDADIPGQKHATASTVPHEPYVTQLLSTIAADKIDQRTIILHKLARERFENVTLTTVQQQLAVAEAVGITAIWGGDKGYVTADELRSLVLDERFPDDWTRRREVHTLWGTHVLVQGFVEEYEREKAKEKAKRD